MYDVIANNNKIPPSKQNEKKMKIGNIVNFQFPNDLANPKFI